MNLVTVEELPHAPIESTTHAYVIRNVGLREGTHKFHRYPGKFIPHVPRWALKRYLDPVSRKVVLDPFCGSGTTLVEAALAGQRGYGLDIDPVARLVSKVKCTAIKADRLIQCEAAIRESLSGDQVGSFRPTIPTLSHWFDEGAVRDLSLIRDVIETYRSEQDIYDFLMVTFLAIIRRVSNADNQTQKTYVSHTHLKTLEPARPLFLSTLRDYINRISEFSHLVRLVGGSSQVLDSYDARTFASSWHTTGLPLADLIITSPPYVMSVDYVYNQMAEYFWIGDLFGLSTQADQNVYKANYIGTQRVSPAKGTLPPETGIELIDVLTSTIHEKSPKNALITYRYFADMESHFREIVKVLRPGSHYVLVVGDSTISSEVVPTHELLPLCAERVGFKLERNFAYEIRNRHMRFPRGERGGLVKFDWILDFRYTS